MNKPQFLAELNQYLTFFTPDERTAIMASYSQRFDEAGEEGEAALFAELGTPMRVAIDLKRRQEAGDDFSDLFGEAPAAAPDYSVETETEQTLAQDELPPEASQEPSDDAPAETDETAETADEAAAPTDADEAAAMQAPAEPLPAEPAPAEPLPAVSPAPAKLSAGRIIGGVLLTIITVAVAICIAVAGALSLTAAGYFIMAGFRSLLTLTDALFLFAGGLVLGGLGLLVVWFAVWAAVSIVTKLFRAPGSVKVGSAEDVSAAPVEQADKERDTK